MRVIVTGGCGFIGSHLVDKLIENKHEVLVIDNLSTGVIENLNPNAKFIYCDVRDKTLETGFSKFKPEIVYHLAAQIDVQCSLENPEYDADVNIGGTINILKMCVKNGVKKIIYASSAAVYGDPLSLPIEEIAPINPISYYGISKYTPENYIKTFSSLFDIKYTILRYANVYGERQGAKGEAGVVSIFMDKFSKKQAPLIYGDGEQTRDLIYVKDVVEANLLVIDKGNNEIFNVSTNTPVKINELFIRMVSIIKLDMKPQYSSSRRGDIQHSFLDNKKINKQLGWKPKYKLVDGLNETISYNDSVIHT